MTEQQHTIEALQKELAYLRQRVAALEAIEIAASTAKSDPGAVFNAACRELYLALQATRVTASILTDDRSLELVLAEHKIQGGNSRLNQVQSIKDSTLAKLILGQKTALICSNVATDPQLSGYQEWFDQNNIAALLVFPLTIEEKVMGWLTISFAEPRQFSSDELSLACGVASQVARATARARLNQDRHLLSTAIEQAADSIIVSDPQGIIVYVNPAFERVSGFRRSEAIGRFPLILTSDVHRPEFYDELWATIKAGRAWHGHLTNRRKDGSFYTVEATITPIKDEQGNITNYVKSQRDVTRELELEKQYRQSQKMEAIGQLTAGIAHDFNNLLMAINGFAELMQFKLPKNSPFQEMASRIVTSGESAANLIRQLLIFSRKQTVEPQILDLSQTIAKIDTMLRRIIGEDIELTILGEPDLWAIKIDPTQLEQVIVNLAINARDAMPRGGNLLIAAENATLSAVDAEDLLEVKPGDHIRLVVADTGVGMSEEIINHIFEPFFTTKETGKGSGLGLATVYGIVRQANGAIQVTSQPDQGTQFTIYFPRADDETTPRPPQKSSTLATGTETVLLVEDSSAVRELITLTLSAQGYNVLKADHGEEALQLFKDHPGKIDLLLTDVVMPYLSGKDLADKILAMQPDLAVIFTSGYTNDTIANYGIATEEHTFLQKPFSPATLVNKVRDVLDRAAVQAHHSPENNPAQQNGEHEG